MGSDSRTIKTGITKQQRSIIGTAEDLTNATQQKSNAFRLILFCQLLYGSAQNLTNSAADVDNRIPTINCLYA